VQITGNRNREEFVLVGITTFMLKYSTDYLHCILKEYTQIGLASLGALSMPLWWWNKIRNLDSQEQEGASPLASDFNK
jgi:hypothetical protein